MNQSTKELMELLTGVKLLLLSAKKIMADKKVNVADLPAVMELVQKSNVLVEAITGYQSIPAEVKDLDATEAQAIVAEIYALVKEVKAQA